VGPMSWVSPGKLLLAFVPSNSICVPIGFPFHTLFELELLDKGHWKILM
jgi:hypothetical protein